MLGHDKRLFRNERALAVSDHQRREITPQETTPEETTTITAISQNKKHTIESYPHIIVQITKLNNLHTPPAVPSSALNVVLLVTLHPNVHKLKMISHH
jgi:hypothetical protein